MSGSPHYVFGYGSLAAEHDRGHRATLHGHRRVWGVAMDNRRDLPGYKYYRLRADSSRPQIFVAFLDIAADPESLVTGICLPVCELQLRDLDRRERNYERVDVSAAVEGARGRVWAYRGSHAGRARLREGVASGRAAVSREYLDRVLAAIAVLAPQEAQALQRAAVGLERLDLERFEIAPAPAPGGATARRSPRRC